MSRCDIIIPVWNQLDETRQCINSIRENTEFPYRLIIIDNGSDSETAEYLESLKRNFSNIALIKNKKNEGFVTAVNKGMAESSADYVCVSNNDIIVTKGWLKEMVHVAESSPEIGIVNPSSNSLGQRIPKGERIEEYAKGLKKYEGRYVDLGTALGFCMLIKKRVIEEIGMFDEIFSPGNFEDTDFSLKARKAGFKCVRALASYVCHLEMTSFKKIARYRERFERNKRIFEARWGRQERVLFILNQTYDKGDDIYGMIAKELDGGNWVYIANRQKNADLNGHSRAIIYEYRANFGTRVLLKIIFKKKKFDRVYCDSEKFSGLLDLLRPIHNARISRIEGSVLTDLRRGY